MFSLQSHHIHGRGDVLVQLSLGLLPAVAFVLSTGFGEVLVLDCVAGDGWLNFDVF